MLTWGTSGCGALGRVGPRLRDPKPTLLRPAPVLFKRAPGGSRVVIMDVACGTYSTFALAEGGTVYAWGLNNYGQLALPGLVRPASMFVDGTAAGAVSLAVANVSRACIACGTRCPFSLAEGSAGLRLSVNNLEQLALLGLVRPASCKAKASPWKTPWPLPATCVVVAPCSAKWLLRMPSICLEAHHVCASAGAQVVARAGACAVRREAAALGAAPHAGAIARRRGAVGWPPDIRAPGTQQRGPCGGRPAARGGARGGPGRRAGLRPGRRCAPGGGL